MILDKNGVEIDPITIFAQNQHLYAEGPDFLLSDVILYPHYHLIIHLLPKETMLNLLPKTLLWYDRVSLLYQKCCEDIIGKKLTLNGLKIEKSVPRHWPSKEKHSQSFKHGSTSIARAQKTADYQR